MSSQTTHHSWTYTAISVLAGLGAGYLVGLITAKFVWKSRPPQRQRQRTPTRTDRVSDASLVTALNALSSEVGKLHEAMEGGRGVLSGGRARRGPRTVDSSEFVSARSESVDSDGDEFFDITTPNLSGDASPSQNTSVPHNEQEAHLDELGKTTQESEEVCTTLIEQLQSRLEESPGNVGLLWRLARALTHLSMHKLKQEETEEEKQLLQQAAEYAQQGLDIDDSCWQLHQWYATAIGCSSKFQGTQQKIQQGHEYKEHIDTAINLNPDNATLHYLCGRWCYEVAGLSWLEKKAAAALFASPPDATFDETLQCFMQAEELNPGKWKGNMLMIAKCHIKLGDVPTALDWLNKGYDLATITPDDETSQKEIEELLLQHDENFMA